MNISTTTGTGTDMSVRAPKWVIEHGRIRADFVMVARSMSNDELRAHLDCRSCLDAAAANAAAFVLMERGQLR